MKRKLLLSALLFAGLPVMADGDSDSELTYYLRMVGTNGSEVTVPFSEKPEIRYINEALVLMSEEINMEYPNGTLEYFDITTERAQSGLYSVFEDNFSAHGMITDKSIIFTGGIPGDRLTVVAIDGTVLLSARLDEDGNASIPFMQEKKGIYVINSGNTTFKIIKK